MLNAYVDSFKDGHVEDESIFDLFKISSITRKTIGAKLFKGHDWDSPAYRFIRFDHIPAVSTPALHQILKQVQNNEGFVFVATIRQDKGSRGTLIGLEGPSGSRQFEIVSNGRANTLDLLYMVEGSQNVVSFEDVDLSDSQWKNITLNIHGENAHLYVGCSLIDSVILDEPFYEHLRPEGSQMFVAKGSIRENHFRVRAVLLHEQHLNVIQCLLWNSCIMIFLCREIGKKSHVSSIKTFYTVFSIKL